MWLLSLVCVRVYIAYRVMALRLIQHSLLYSISFIRLQGKRSKFYSDLRNASSLELTKYYCVAVTMPIELSSYATWSTGEMVASVQLQLNSLFVYLEEVLIVTSL